VSAKIKDYIKLKTNKQTNNIELFLQKAVMPTCIPISKTARPTVAGSNMCSCFIIVAVFILIIALHQFHEPGDGAFGQTGEGSGRFGKWWVRSGPR
jgi:putative ABC transport system permease protein